MKILPILLGSSLFSFSIMAEANNHDILSSDASIPTPATITGSLLTQGFVGTGVSALSKAQIDVTQVSFEEAAFLKTLKGYNTGVEPEALWGLDSRVQVKPASYPYRAITLIQSNTLLCTGWLLSKDTVITAGHCVHNGANKTWVAIDNITVYPGADGTSFPFGKCKAKRTYTTKGWGELGLAEFDYAAIKLDCDIGNATGWFGVYAPNDSTNLPTVIAGYPAEKSSTQWTSFSTIKRQTTDWLVYSNDTTAGESGAPVWFDDKQYGVLAFGIHTYKYPKNNRGKRIDAAVFQNLETWKQAN